MALKLFFVRFDFNTNVSSEKNVYLFYFKTYDKITIF